MLPVLTLPVCPILAIEHPALLPRGLNYFLLEISGHMRLPLLLHVSPPLSLRLLQLMLHPYRSLSIAQLQCPLIRSQPSIRRWQLGFERVRQVVQLQRELREIVHPVRFIGHGRTLPHCLLLARVQVDDLQFLRELSLHPVLRLAAH